MQKMRVNKKGISPVIATVLLVGMVVVIGLIIFMWFKATSQEAVIKFDKNAELVCDEVVFDASYSNGALSISNDGNVPIIDFKIKLENEGSYNTENIKNFGNGWPNEGIIQGGTAEVIASLDGYTRVTLTPILLGETEDKQRSYTCDEARHGLVVDVA